MTSVRSSRGPSGSGPAALPPSTAPPCGATSPTSPPAATPGAPSPGGPPPCGATSAGCDAPGAIEADPTVGLSAPRGDGRLPRVLRPDELRVAARRSVGRPVRGAADGPGPARRRRARGALRQWPAGGRAVRTRRRRRRPRPASPHRLGQGVQAAGGAPRRARGRRRRAVARVTAATRSSPRPRPPAPSFLNARGGASRPATPAASSTAGRRRRPTRTPCATPSPPTCSTAAPTSASCRSCSGIQTWRPRSVTLTSPRNGFARCSVKRTRGPDRRTAGMRCGWGRAWGSPEDSRR